MKKIIVLSVIIALLLAVSPVMAQHHGGYHGGGHHGAHGGPNWGALAAGVVAGVLIDEFRPRYSSPQPPAECGEVVVRCMRDYNGRPVNCQQFWESKPCYPRY
jgi:hypothetical protein